MWQFALHGFSNVYKVFIIVLMRLSELFSQDFRMTLPAYYFENLETGI